ncbi:fungal-specific transcription factor domain-containing protein [Scheffersomyces coipomensis]|uniref:fungal-specific transcription factor domain-containing protein n=1 Tax=Scheffersomyces coipomensis TaxID=1788519 RepID=UPI00315DB3D1
MTRKSRTFNGCWTCRSRKVKCDLGKPKCDRCKKAGLDCAGYNIILGWSSPLTVSKTDNSLITLANEDENPDSFQRRNVELVRYPKSMTYTTYKALSRELDRLDEYVFQNRYKIRVGPFGVYKVNLIGNKEDEEIMESIPLKRKQSSTSMVSSRPSSSIGDSVDSRGKISNVRSDLSRSDRLQTTSSIRRYNINKESIFSKTNNTWVHYELLDYAKLTILGIKGSSYEFNEQNMLHILYPNFFPNIDSDDWLVDSNYIKNKLYHYDPSQRQLVIKSLFQVLFRGLNSKLFSFNRVYWSDNYFDTLIIPYINNIVCQFICYDFTKWDKTFDLRENPDFTPVEFKQNIKYAIVNLIIGILAFKKSLEVGGNVINDDNSYYVDEYLKLSIELRKLSIGIINFHLDEYDNDDDEDEENDDNKPKNESLEYENLLLLGLILQIELDNRFSIYENFDLIFAIGDNIIKDKFKHTKLSNMTKFLVIIFKISYMIYESTQSINDDNYSIAMGDEKLNYRDLNEAYDLVREKDVGDDDDDDDDEDDDEEDEDEGKKGIQIKPTIQNLIISTSDSNSNDNTSTSNASNYMPTYTPMSFTISFNKRKLGGYDEAERSDMMMTNNDSIKSTNSNYKVNGRRRDSLITIPSTKVNFYTNIDNNSIHLMYGIPKSLLDIFHEIIHLTNHKNIFNKRKVFPRNFPKICADIEDKLINWDISKVWQLNTDDNKLHKAIWLNVVSFQQAIIVYFYRLIKHARNKPSVIKSISYLEELVELIQNHNVEVKPLFWPLLICGSELDHDDIKLQRKVIAMWQDYDCYSNTVQYNYWRSKQILYEVWKRKEIGEEIGFMDMIREWDVKLCLF